MTHAKGLILIVEDEMDLNQIMAEMLRGEGYEVLQAYDGAEGLRLYRQNAARLNLVLCDISMPNLGGFEFLRAAMRQFGFVPFVVLSAYDDVSKLVEAARLDAVDYVVKPVAILNLIEHLPLWLKAAQRKSAASATVSL